MARVEEIQHLLFLYLGCILIVFGLSTNQWSVNRNSSGFSSNAGLFQSCFGGICGNNDRGGLQSLAVIGLVLGFICAVAMTVHYLTRKQSNKALGMLPTMTLLCAIVGGALVIMTLMIFGYDYFGRDVYPGYSFVLCLIGAIFLIAGGINSSKQ